MIEESALKPVAVQEGGLHRPAGGDTTLDLRRKVLMFTDYGKR